MPPRRSHTASSDRSQESRARILDAAVSEFSAHGLAGARTDRIAASAGVNKALLYYYFSSKENLYIAALELSADKIRDRSMAVYLLDATPGERLLRVALDHFDRILAQHEFQGLMQQEMMRLHRGESGAMSVLVQRLFGPLQSLYKGTVEEGVTSGELISADWVQLQLSSLGANVFYFLSAPVTRLVTHSDPFDREVLASRRKAMMEFLGQTIFQNRAHGAEVAARVLADMPMPEGAPNRHIFGRNNERAQ